MGELEKFIQDMVMLPHDREYLNNLYGNDQVSAWLSDLEVLKKIKLGMDERKIKRARNKDLFLEDIFLCRNKSLQNLIKILNDKEHKDHVKVSQMFMQAELSYIEAYFKARGEMDAQKGDEKMGTILELVYAKKTD